MKICQINLNFLWSLFYFLNIIYSIEHGDYIGYLFFYETIVTKIHWRQYAVKKILTNK